MANGRARIVFLDDNEDLRELLPMLLESALKVECISFGQLSEFENHSEEVLCARLAILDINLGPNQPDGIDALNWLTEHGFQGKTLFFTGHARSNPHVAVAQSKGIQVLEKPLDPDKLISFIRQALEVT
jgi:DNA-binding NtrC family response regulator